MTGASSVIRGLAYPPVSGHWNDRKHESFEFLVISIGLGSMFLCFFSFLDPFSSGQPACPSLDSGCRSGDRKDAGDLRKVYGDFNFVKNMSSTYYFVKMSVTSGGFEDNLEDFSISPQP